MVLARVLVWCMLGFRMVHARGFSWCMLGFRWREKQERALKEKQRQEGGKSTKEGMAFDLVLSIFAFLAVAALLGILVYQVNNNPIPFPSLPFLFCFCVPVGSFSVYKCSCSFFLLNEFHWKEEAPSSHVKLCYLLFLIAGGGEREEENFGLGFN